MPDERELPAPATDAELEDALSRPTPGLLDSLGRIHGDVVVLGAGGKMGPSLARMLRRALDALGRTERVVAVSRFSSPEAESKLREAGVETIRCDLTDPTAVATLPSAPNVIFMAGQKFGTASAPGATWALNTVAPGIVAQRYAAARVVALSTGNVYPLSPVTTRGSIETDAVGPVGEYAMSCLGRERVFEYFSERHGTPVAIVRLNYAIELRYGVLADIARRVYRSEPVDVRMGHVNVIWQGDANAYAIRCLEHAASPPFVLNVTGREAVATRTLAAKFGERFRRPPVIVGTEAHDALLSNATRAAQLFGVPSVSLETMITWVAAWVRQGGSTLGKPTHFETRDGRF